MPSLSNVLPPPVELCNPLHTLQTFLLSGRKASIADVTVAPQSTGNPVLELNEHVGADRAAVETFISQRFAESFGSHIEAFMPRLFSVRNREGVICGAFGLRSASRNLFLEQYLDAPIEQAIAAHAGVAVERRTIVEVGHFSGAMPGVVRAMIGLLTQHLHREGFEWVVFTGTTELRNAFFRLGLSPIDIQAASIDRLPPETRMAWGSYYDHAPRVLVGKILEGYQAMQPDPVSDRLATEAVA